MIPKSIIKALTKLLGPAAVKAQFEKFLETPHDCTPEELKGAFSQLMALEEEQMAKKNSKPDFSPWPPEMPERKCDWRQSDELQKYRLRVPEPSQCDHHRVRYRIDQEFPMSFSQYGDVPKMEDYTDGEFEKKLFRQKGVSFWAWTADGKTPVFPIPL